MLFGPFFLEPHTALDHCPRILLLYFRARTSDEHATKANKDKEGCTKAPKAAKAAPSSLACEISFAFFLLAAPLLLRNWRRCHHQSLPKLCGIFNTSFNAAEFSPLLFLPIVSKEGKALTEPAARKMPLV